MIEDQMQLCSWTSDLALIPATGAVSANED